MAPSMMKRRQEAERLRAQAYDATLRRVSRAPRPAPDFEKALEEAKRGFAHLIVREAMFWRPKLKTRDPARLRLAAARYLFANYPVAAPLERIWLDTAGLDDAEVRLRKGWYVIAARGGSLWKEAAGKWLTRKEAHAFLNPPGDLSFEEAFWQAVARGFTDDLGMALRIARSKIAATPRAELAFWREAARFFCQAGASLAEIDDLCDFLAAAKRRTGGFSLKGRTLASLNRLMAEWHRDLDAIERIEAARRVMAAQGRAGGQQRADGGRWPGSPLADWSWQPSAKDARTRNESFAVRQLRTAAELAEETRAMRHCVSTYAAKCIAGQASIWSLTHKVPGKTERLLTIELDRQNRAAQVRGFANRLAHADEVKVLMRWGKARGVVV